MALFVRVWLWIWMWFCIWYSFTAIIHVPYNFFLYPFAKLKLMNTLLLQVFCAMHVYVWLWVECAHTEYFTILNGIGMEAMFGVYEPDVRFIFKISEKLCIPCIFSCTVRTPMSSFISNVKQSFQQFQKQQDSGKNRLQKPTHWFNYYPKFYQGDKFVNYYLF